MNGSDYVNSFSHSGKPVADLGRIASLLKALGNPQDDLRFIHIAGTNGKGSIARMLDGICIDAGLKTGLFTSPYIFRYNDRIKINDEDIPDEEIDEYCELIKDAVEASPYKNEFSQFEITMCIAFLHFKRHSCDIVILEAGVGGRLDCTNIIKTTIACVIGSVSYDHTQILGETLSEIASQKAGIIKEGVECILSSGCKEEVREIFKREAVAKNAKLIIPSGNLKVLKADITSSEFEYCGEHYALRMQGEHMIRNALSVIECMKEIGDDLGINEENIKEGLSQAKVPARVQVLSEKPLLILDGAHNPDGMAALADVLRKAGRKPCRAVIGMCRDKNLRLAIGELIGTVNEFYTCQSFSERAENAEDLAEVIRELGAKAKVCETGPYEKAKELMQSDPESLTVICGSLYLCSDILGGLI